MRRRNRNSSHPPLSAPYVEMHRLINWQIGISRVLLVARLETAVSRLRARGYCRLRPLVIMSHAVRVVSCGLVDNGLGQLGDHPYGRGRVAWMDEDDGLTLIQLGPDGREGLVPEILYCRRMLPSAFSSSSVYSLASIAPLMSVGLGGRLKSRCWRVERRGRMRRCVWRGCRRFRRQGRRGCDWTLRLRGFA